MFNKEYAEEVFDNFMMNRACQAALFSDFVSILNMKALELASHPEKMEVLTDILNDLKLFTTPTNNQQSH